LYVQWELGMRLWRSHRAVVLVAAVVVVAAAVVALVWPVTDLIAAHDVGRITGAQRAVHLQAARESVRTQLLTLTAGEFAAGALVFTGRNFGLARRTFRLTERGQVTDRYTKAVEQLGSAKLDVRIGGIYALERVARDSATDHPTVMEVLAAFIREHSREQWPRPEPGAAMPEHTTRPDVQAAITVIGHRDSTHDRARINLARANLTGADLVGANLSSPDQTGGAVADAEALGKLPLADSKRADLLRARSLSFGVSATRGPGPHSLLDDAGRDGATSPPGEAAPDGYGSTSSRRRARMPSAGRRHMHAARRHQPKLRNARKDHRRKHASPS
jgi:Pentapeptide repeats (8 copies)